MKLVKVQIELVITENETFLIPGETTGGMFTPRYDRGKIASYLNNKLYTDPEFFGDFGAENIVNVVDFD
jgi:hypothetical protein